MGFLAGDVQLSSKNVFIASLFVNWKRKGEVGQMASWRRHHWRTLAAVTMDLITVLLSKILFRVWLSCHSASFCNIFDIFYPRSFSGLVDGILAILSFFATSLSSSVQNLCTRNYLEISLEAFCNMGRGLGFVVFASCLLAMLWGGHRLKITHLVVPQRTLARFLKKPSIFARNIFLIKDFLRENLKFVFFFEIILDL